LEAKKKYFFCQIGKKAHHLAKCCAQRKKKPWTKVTLLNCQIAKSTSLSGLPANEFQAAHNFIFLLGCPMPEFFSSL
jgi:hypothetical protein